LIYWQLLRIEEARVLFEQCGDIPGYAPFYIARGILFQDVQAEYCHPCNDFAAAVKIDPGDWITWHYLINFLQLNSSFKMQLEHSHQAYLRFPANHVIRTDYAKALVNTSRYNESIKVLDEGKILPEEEAPEDHDIFELANLSLAVEMMERGKYRKALKYLNNSGKWPENTGNGKSYEPDTRFRDYIAAFCYMRIGKRKPADILYNQIIECSLRDYIADEEVFNLFISNQVLNELGKKQEADLALEKWKTDQDSLFHGNISDGSTSLKSQWLLARYLGEEEKAVILEKQISSVPTENRFRLFIKTLNYINKVEK
jgi:tetratricopeptide (TPR) repeat protein